MAVVIVEDEPAVRKGAVRILQAAGFEVLEAGTAEAGLRLIQREPRRISHLLADHHLPGDMTGLQLARLISVNWPFITTIVTSGDLDVRGQALLYGMHYMPKPWTRERLLAALTGSRSARTRLAS